MNKTFYNNLGALINTINKTFKNINMGGCGHFAIMLGDKLTSVDKDVKVVCLQRGIQTEDIAYIKEVYKCLPDDLNELNVKGGYISHIVLKCDDKYIDSNGIRNKKQLLEEFVGFEMMAETSLDKLKLWCGNGVWNEVFDVGQLPKMKHVLDTYFNRELTIMNRLKIQLENLVD